MGFFIGADLDWVARFHREGPVRRNGVIENRTGEYRRSGRGEARHEFAGGPAADTSNGQQQDGRRDLRQAPGTIASPLCKKMRDAQALRCAFVRYGKGSRSEEHTSELQSRRDLVCRLLLEKKKKNRNKQYEYKNKKKNNNIN